MKFTRTRIESDIDLDAEGKHCGFLRIPHSVHRSAYGWLPMPVISIRNGDGPRVLLMGGKPRRRVTRGQIRAVQAGAQPGARSHAGPPAGAPHGELSGRAGGPEDVTDRRGKPESQLSPGGPPTATVTQMIAHLIEEELLTNVEVVCDFHSGGSSLLYLPSVQFPLQDDGTLSPLARDSRRKSHGSPYTHVYVPGDIQCSGATKRKGVLRVSSEFAGAGTVTPEALRFCEQGLARVLHRLGALKQLPAGVEAPGPTRLLEIKDDVHFVYASEIGVHEPLVELGDEVKAGDPAGAIHFPETPWREPVVEHFEAAGVVVCKRVPPGAPSAATACFHLASDWSG